MLPLLILDDALEADSLLKMRITIEERYLPVTDFARRLSAKTGQRILVEGRLAPRKLAIFVKDRAVAETMAHAADALEGDWSRTKDGWRLSPAPETARLEAAAPKLRDAVQRQAFAAWLREAVQPKPRASSGLEGRTAALLREIGLEKATEALLAGEPLIATGDGRGRTIPIPMEDAFYGANAPSPMNALLVVRRDPSSGRVTQTFRSLGQVTSNASLSNLDPMAAQKRVPDEIERRDVEWARSSQEEVRDAKLRDLPAEIDPYGSNLASLADLLARLHARSGVPVVAESFRAPTAFWGDPHGATVDEALRSVESGPVLSAGVGARFLWRGSGGWIIARTPEAWRLRMGEIAEGRIRPLEKKGVPSLADYASLAGSLTAVQRSELEIFRPLATFPTVALRQGCGGLLVYDALPPAMRSRVAVGVPFSELPRLAQERWRQTAMNEVYTRVPPEPWVDAVLRDRMPNDASFSVNLENSDVQEVDLGPSATRRSSKGLLYRTWSFRFGTGENALVVHAPLTPVAP